MFEFIHSWKVDESYWDSYGMDLRVEGDDIADCCYELKDVFLLLSFAGKMCGI